MEPRNLPSHRPATLRPATQNQPRTRQRSGQKPPPASRKLPNALSHARGKHQQQAKPPSVSSTLSKNQIQPSRTRGQRSPLIGTSRSISNPQTGKSDLSKAELKKVQAHLQHALDDLRMLKHDILHGSSGVKHESQHETSRLQQPIIQLDRFETQMVAAHKLLDEGGTGHAVTDGSSSAQGRELVNLLKSRHREEASHSASKSQPEPKLPKSKRGMERYIKAELLEPYQPGQAGLKTTKEAVKMIGKHINMAVLIPATSFNDKQTLIHALKGLKEILPMLLESNSFQLAGASNLDRYEQMESWLTTLNDSPLKSLLDDPKLQKAVDIHGKALSFLRRAESPTAAYFSPTPLGWEKTP